MTSMKSSCGPERNNPQDDSLHTMSNPQCRPFSSMRDGQRHCTDMNDASGRLPQGRQSTNLGAQGQCPVPRPTTGDRGNPTALRTSALKGDTTKLTCYRCSNIGHIASDMKCPQYKKPEQQQIFTAQIINDHSDGEHPDQATALAPRGDSHNADHEEDPKGNFEIRTANLNGLDEYHDGS